MPRINVGDFMVGKEEKEVINTILESGKISEGKFVKLFEKEWANFIGTKYCVAVNSGTSALLLGLLALKYDERFKKFKDGAKIITSPITYIATSNAISLSNMQPVYGDIDLKTFKLKTDEIKSILKNSDADEFAGILPVHLMGYPNDMDQINEIAQEYDLVVFEDSAQAHGTTYNEKKTGSLGFLSAFSFYIAHNIQAGEMGCVMTNDERLFKLMLKLKANGRSCDCIVCVRSRGNCPHLNGDFDPRFNHEYVSYNFKTMEFQASLGNCQIKKVGDIIKKRQENVRYLNKCLEKYSDILQLPPYSRVVSYLGYPIIIKKPELLNRRKIINELEYNGIETRPLFGCIPTQQPAYSYLKEEYEGRIPNAEYVGLNGFYIGCHQYLTCDDLDYIVEIFDKIMEKKNDK